MKIEFVRLSQIDKTEIIELMNDSLVRKHMPLFKDVFSEDDYFKFIATKEAMWEEHGFGPWGFLVDKKFSGWGGLQPEDGEVDLALVLSPKSWGVGRTIFNKIRRIAFGEMKLKSLTVLLPPSRSRIRGLLSLGFVLEGEVLIEGQQFLRYRLSAMDTFN